MGLVWRLFVSAMLELTMHSLFFLIPDRIRRILAGTCFVPGALLTRFGWAMNQSLSERGTTSMYDGFWEMIMFFFGIILMYISLSLWPWNSYVEESQS
tara:strand:- start:122 stop:415 length:294 start_codon:yes stop_codon:yes gene_type:complete